MIEEHRIYEAAEFTISDSPCYSRCICTADTARNVWPIMIYDEAGMAFSRESAMKRSEGRREIRRAEREVIWRLRR